MLGTSFYFGTIGAGTGVSARRPCEAAPCQHVKMQVLDTLAAVLPHIGDNAVALFIYAQLTALVGNHSVDVPQQCGIFFGQCCGRSNVLLWNDQKVYRRLGSMS